MEYFQDDLFPPTRDWTQPPVSAGQWLSGDDTQPVKVSLKPADMIAREFAMTLCAVLPLNFIFCCDLELCGLMHEPDNPHGNETEKNAVNFKTQMHL